MNLDDGSMREHTEVDMTPPSWTEPGVCQCGAPLPPMAQWDDPGRDWSMVTCEACGWQYVDEDEYLACYPPDDEKDEDE